MKQKILHLTLRKKWFDMILSGEKKEEYREIKEYWVKRLFVNHREFFQLLNNRIGISMFTHICFINGYQKNAPRITIECLGYGIGIAKSEWSDNWQGEVLIIKLGKILETKNLY